MKNVHEEQPRLSEVWASSVPLPVEFHQSIQPYKLFVFVVFLIPIFSLFGAIYRVGGGGGRRDGWGELSGLLPMSSGVGVLESVLP